MTRLAQLKTQPTVLDVNSFIEHIADEQKRKDSQEILQLMQQITKEKPRIWGSAIIGFGSKRYKSPATSREVDWFIIGFSPRKANLSIYLIIDFKKHTALLNKLGKHKTGVGCLYINKLEDVDVKVLEQLIEAAVNK